MYLKVTRLFFCFVIVFFGPVNIALAEPCTDQNTQSAACRGIKTYFYAKYKMDLGVGAGIKLLSVSCDMKAINRQCRDYALLESSSKKLDEMREGCKSMGGHFSSKRCSTDNVLSSCRNIVRNYHSPDVIYATTLYKSEDPTQADINLNDRRYTCQSLGGSFRLPAKTK